MKASRSMLRRPFQTVTSGPGSGSSATQPTPAQRLKSTEMSSPAAVTLTRQSPSSAPSSRNILASSSKLKTGSAASPQEKLVVNTSNRPRSSFTISQNCLGARFLMGGLLSPTQLFRLHGCFAYSGARGQNRWPQHPEPFRHLNAPVVPLIYLLPYPKAHRFSSVFDIDDAHNLGDRAVFSDHREQLLTLPDADDGSVVGPRSVYALRFTLFGLRSRLLHVAARPNGSVLDPYQTRLHHHLRRQCSVDRAHLGDLQKPPALRLLQRTRQLELETYAVDLAILGLAFLAVPGVDLLVTQTNRGRIHRPTLAIRVQAQGHRGA